MDRTDADHPDRGGSTSSTGVGWGRYWTITPAGSGYTCHLSLPHDVSPDSSASVCRYVGGEGAGWNCARATSTAATVTRTGVIAFSDWAVGNHVGPTAVALRSLQAAAPVFNVAEWWAELLRQVGGIR